MFQLKVLIDLGLTKQTIIVNFFFDEIQFYNAILYNVSIAQRYQTEVYITEKSFLSVNHEKSVLLQEEITQISLESLKRLTKASFRTSDDFEYVLTPSIGNEQLV